MVPCDIGHIVTDHFVSPPVPAVGKMHVHPLDVLEFIVQQCHELVEKNTGGQVMTQDLMPADEGIGSIFRV